MKENKVYCAMKVLLAKEEGTWEMVAVKQLSKAQEDEASATNEVRLLHAVSSHTFCPRLRAAYQDERSAYIAMVSPQALLHMHSSHASNSR